MVTDIFTLKGQEVLIIVDNFWGYPETHNIRTVPIDDILTVVDPRTRTGRVYTLSKKEITSTSEKFRITSDISCG